MTDAIERVRGFEPVGDPLPGTGPITAVIADPSGRVGRPSDFSPEIADKICDLLAGGESMRSICAAKGMPNRSTVIRWLAVQPDFATKCAHARILQADVMDDRILEVADACTPETAQADRVKISAYQWRASKLAPKKYGDKLSLSGDTENPVRMAVDVTLTPAEAYIRMLKP